MVPRTAIDLIRALPTLFPSTLAPLPSPPLSFHVLLPLVAFLFSNPLPSLSLSLSLLLSVVRLSAADHLSSAPPSRLAARLPPIIIFNSPWWSASPPSVVLFFSPPFLFVRWSPSSSSLNTRERKKKEKKKREKGKNRWEYYCNVSPFCCVLEDTYLEGRRNLNRGGRDARVLLLRIPVGTGRDIIDLGGFSFFFFFEDKRFLLDCALLICLMAE